MGAIEINGMRKVFRGKRLTRIVALSTLTLAVEPGEIFGFLGPNGAGKSTTIKLLTGLIRPTSGKASIMGVDVGKAHARKSVGYLPENPAFYDYLNASEYLEIVGRAFGMSGRKLQTRCEEVLRLLGLWEARKRPIRSYSKGMVQRVGLAQTLVHDPDVYILDEPMSGLDPLGRTLVKEIMLDLKRQGKCIFFSTHITSDVESVCDRVGVIVKGEMQCVRNVDEITVGGITGYTIRFDAADNEASETMRVAEEELPTTLADLQSSGKRVLMVEPVRKNLEDFFVDIVRHV